MQDKHKTEDASLVEPITRREQEILALLDSGYTNQEIANRLYLAPNTVKWYARQIYAKLGVKNRRQAGRRARELGLVRAGDEQGNLPKPLTPFIGRQTEQEQILASLSDPETRLITLTGFGGIGKTRLAIEAAARLAAEPGNLFRDGIFFVPLATRSQPNEIILAIAEALQHTVYEKGTCEQIINFLAPKHLLLVLDNLEQISEGTKTIGEILSAAPWVKILATARQPLRLHVEKVFDVPGLPFPEERRTCRFMQYPAVELFDQRARHIKPDFSVDESERESIIRICQLTQGTPLAIELAASWVNILSCGEIVQEIERSLDILTADMQDIPERQRSIRAVFDHSWQLLSMEEKSVLMRLNVFSGGFSRNAVEEIAGASLSALSGLVQKSLIARGANRRFEIHELVRQYAGEKLQESGQLGEVRSKHADYFADTMAQLDTRLKSSEQASALREIGLDLDNIRAAWSWITEQLDVKAADRMLDSLYLYCVLRRGSLEGDRMLRTASECFTADPGEAARVLRARLNVRHEMLIIDFIQTNDPEAMQQAAKNIDESLKVAQRTGSSAEIGFCYFALGRTAMWSLELPQAISLFENALSYFRQAQDKFYTAYCLYRIGFSQFMQGKLEQAVMYYEQCLKLTRSTGNLYVAAWTLEMLADIMFAMDRVDKSIRYRQEAMELHIKLEDRQGTAWVKTFLAFSYINQGQPRDAERLSREALDLSKEINHPTTSALALTAQSRILSGRGEMQAAKHMAEEALSLISISFTNPATLIYSLAYATCLDGDIPTVKQYLSECVRNYKKFGYVNLIISCLPIQGILLLREGRPEASAQVLALALNHPRRLEKWLEKDLLVQTLQQQLHATLTDEDLSKAWQQGESLNLEDVISQILQDAS